MQKLDYGIRISMTQTFLLSYLANTGLSNVPWKARAEHVTNLGSTVVHIQTAVPIFSVVESGASPVATFQPSDQ